MASVFSKLNLKEIDEILVINAPETFEAELNALTGVTVQRAASAMQAVSFCLAFVTRLEEIKQITAAVTPKAKGDALIWFAYPKGTSRRYTCEFNRDTGWQVLGDAGYEPVRQVAIDEDWSALRFRKVEYIKKLTRSRLGAISEKGKQRTSKE